MINFDQELQEIFRNKYQGCTQLGDELVEYRLKEGEIATEEELAKVGKLYKGARKEIGEVKVKLFGTETEPTRSTHISTIDAIDTSKTRPVRIKRVWEGRDYFYDCFVTESVKDQFVAGGVAVGDYVLIHFDDIGEQIVTAKVFKSW